ncbi:sensor histidine kinase [Brevibacillus panacihumi]|uniref:sensor histidine kinase n=1 Tax=Brevibacillus panacihumi TaxID=497735 RepID=UPI003CFE6ABE
MRTLRIRTVSMLCLFFILNMPWWFFLTAHFMETGTLSFATNQPQHEVFQRQQTETMNLIQTNSDKWMDPNWQNQLDSLLQEAKLEVTLFSASDQEIYRSNPEHDHASQSTERFTIIEDGRVLGKVVMYVPKSNTVQIIAAVAGLLLAFFIVAVVMRRLLLKPLEQMSVAARQIAAGDWDVQLPLSRITEIAEVRDGFEVMVRGLQKSHQKQVVLEEERRFMIASVAHDLRTPLFSLRGYLDGLEQGIAQTPEKRSKYVAVCKEKAAQLGLLVEDLFTFTKMEYLETELSSKSVDLALILQKSIDSLNPRAQQKHISITSHFAEPCTIIGDTHLLERAVNNLLENAVRHTPAHGDIVVQCQKEEKKVMFTIRDTGPGFSSEELQRVFDPLYRGDASRNRSTGGSGLGLTISQRIMRRHGGDLAAGNHAEGGALLTGWIPVTDPD